jgi:glutaminase
MGHRSARSYECFSRQATVGLPAKSSQAGVIMAVIPNCGGIVVYSPPLNVFGNSAKGTEFFKQLIQKLPELKK